MDRISGLSDDLLVKILSFLPIKVAISTSILSKRWECLWLWLPKLKYVIGYRPPSACERLRCFLDRKLPLHRAPVIESFRLVLFQPHFKPEDIKLWLAIAISRGLRKLSVAYISDPYKRNIFPSSLYNCKSLVTLKLSGDIALDIPRMVCLPSLKTLTLQFLTLLNGESLRRFLSVCPVLGNLVVDLFANAGKISINVPSLLSLSLSANRERNIEGLEMNTPSLKYLKIVDLNKENHPFSIENMPKLEEAYIDVRRRLNLDSLIGSITSVKRLTLCSKVVYGIGYVFNQLEHLKLCDCTECSSKLLARLLKNSPNLQVLDIFQMVNHGGSNMLSWNEPTTVPDCIMSRLQTLNWSGYLGSPQERDVAVYILKNSRHLKTATISSNESIPPKFEMIKELSRSARASATCELIFN